MKRLMVVCLIIFVIIPVSVMSQPQQKPPKPVIEFDPVENPYIEVAIENNLTFFLDNEIRKVPPGGAYMVPPTGKIDHCDFNVSDKVMKFVFIIRKPCEQRLEKRPCW